MTPICGLDLSLTATGIACAYHTDVLKPPKGCTGMARLDWIRAEIMEHVGLFTSWAWPQLVVIEGYSMGAQRGSAGVAQMMGELGGLVRWTLWDRGVPYMDVPPSVLKKFATGKGNAPKDAVLSAAIRAGYDGSDNNGADAWWLRQMGLYATGQVTEAASTAYRGAMIAKLDWPEQVAA